MNLETTCHAAAAALRDAETLVITAGAGMGVDSGLPDFRGDEGFWNAYPPYRKLGLSFIDAANPEHFERDPAFGWGFYGHRTNLYRATVPHPGFALLLEWARNSDAYFVVTSNIDGQFQKAGFPEGNIVEVHGSIHHLQCTTPCSMNLWANDETIPVNEETMRARAIPRCRHCGAIARPNILMFGDGAWISRRSEAQQQRYLDFLAARRGMQMVVIELGAGTAIPTIRAASERLGYSHKATVIRINPREPYIDAPHLSLPCGAVQGLSGIARALRD